MMVLTQELAGTVKDPAEAARLLASYGDYLAAAERCLADPAFMHRATLAQLMLLHAWLLRVGTADAARQAVELWKSQVLQGRTHSDISEALSAAKLALARCLLRQAAGATPPAVSVKPGQDAAVAADAPGGKQGRHKHGRSYAKAAEPAQAAPAREPAALPTASIMGLHQLMQEQPDSQELGEMVAEAVRVLGDAQQGFITTNQPAGMLEALSWSLAAKPDVEISVAQWQLKNADSWGGSRLCDVLEVVGHTQQAVQLLQALASAISDTKSESGSVRGGRRQWFFSTASAKRGPDTQVHTVLHTAGLPLYEKACKGCNVRAIPRCAVAAAMRRCQVQIRPARSLSCCLLCRPWSPSWAGC